MNLIRSLLLFAPLFLGLSPALMAADGESVFLEEAARVRIPPSGFDALAEVVAGLVPTHLPLSGLTGEVACQPGDPPLTYGVDGVDLLVAVEESTITPGDGRLDIHLSLTLSGAGGTVSYGGTCLFELPADSCPFDLPASPITVDLGLALSWDEGTGTVVVPPEEVTLDLELLPLPNPLGTDCFLGYLLEGEELFDVPLQENLIGPFLEEMIGSLPATLAETLTSTLDSLQIATSVDLQAEQPISLELHPTGLNVTAAEGLSLSLGGRAMVVTAASCLLDPPLDISATPGEPPAFTEVDPDGNPYAAQILIADDFVNQFLLAAFRAGLLCTTIDGVVTVGILGVVVPEMLDYADDASDPVRIVVVPRVPPTATFGADPDAMIDLSGLQVDAFAPAFDRLSRVFGLEIAALAGLQVDAVDGVITPGITVDSEDITAVSTYLEPFPGAEEALLSTFPALMATALGSLLGGDLLPTATLPQVYGIAITDLHFAPSEDGLWLSAFANLDSTAVVPMEVDLASACAGGGCDAGCEGGTGCEEGAGCGEEGCEGSCNHARHSPMNGALRLLLVMGMVFGVRQRRYR